MTGQRIYYVMAMVVAAIVASWLLRRTQKGLALPRLQRLSILAAAFLGATLGAKFPFAFQQAEAGLSAWMADGKTILWGLVGGYAGVEIAKWSLRIKRRTGDTFVVPIAVAIGIGRIGCLLFGCCYGCATTMPWGMRFVTAEDAGTLLRHPTQLYELGFHFSCAAIAALLIRRWDRSDTDWTFGDRLLQTNLMPAYIASYAVYRFVSEWLRPEPTFLMGMTFYQLSAIPIALLMLALIVLRSYHTESQILSENH